MTLADHLPVPEEIPQALAGVLMLALALVVLRVAFASRLNRAFALYLTLAGSGILWGALDDTPALETLAFAMWPYFGLASPWALLYLGLRFRERHGGPPVPRIVGWGLLVVAAGLALLYALDHALMLQPGLGNGGRGPLHPLSFAGMGLLISGVLSWWALRRAGEDAGAGRRGLALAGVALMLPVMADASYALTRDAVGLLTTGTLVGNAWYRTALALLLVGAGFAIAALFRLRRLDAPARRLVALPLAAAATSIGSGIVVRSGAWDLAWVGNLVDGVWDATMASLFAYAVLAGQLVDLDAKFRFAISRSTLAAVFIAAFFVGSEAAQQFFGETLGSAYVGIAAAGALVFAMAPLQRVAERLAEQALPVAAPSAVPAGSGGKEDAYRSAVRFALRSGPLDPDDRVHLAHVADELGLSARRAAEILADAERSPGGG